MSEIPIRKMNPEIKEKWLAWLRDPNNTQTVGCLKDDQGYCCLGGLTDVYIKEHEIDWKLDSLEGSFGLPDPHQNQDLEVGVLPSFVMKWAGFDSQNPFVMFKGHRESISRLNDDYEQTFADIADVIEEQF